MGILAALRQKVANAIAPARPSRRSAFSGAAFNRLTQDWIFAATRSPDSELRYELRTLRNRARDLVRNSPFGVRYSQLIVENVIGPNGIRLQAKNKTQEGKLFKRVNDAIERAWSEWSRPENCDLTKRLSLNELLSLEVSAWGSDGEIFLRILRGPEFGEFGLALQNLDPDLLDETLNQASTRTSGLIRQGIEYNEWGVPTFYHVWNRYPDEAFAADRERIRIPASEIIHAFIPLRKGQSRGVPHGAAIMATLKMLDGYIEAEIVAARTASAKMGAIVDADPANPATVDPGAGASDIPAEADPGALMNLIGTGGKLELWDPQHPTNAFPEFTRKMSHFIAVGFGVSYGTLTGDMADANYSSMKVGRQPEQDHWRRYQTFAICHVLDRIYREFLKAAFLNSKIPEITDYTIERWCAVTWQPRGFPSPDPLKDIQADLIEVAAGVRTLTEICAERGRDLEEVLEERKRELELLDEYGVDSVLALGGTLAPGASDSAGADNKPSDTSNNPDANRSGFTLLRTASLR